MSWGYLQDASGFKGNADRICVPHDETELLSLLAEARQASVPITIAGGGSGLTGGRVPFGGWVVSMEKFLRLDVGRGSATVGSGVALQDLHAAAKKTGQFYPPDPTETLAFLGGTIACNSSGSRSFLYGATRRWLNRLRVVLLDGRILDVRRGEAIDFDVPSIPQPASRKHSCGYPLKPGMDWIDLFTGSEGTLGFVVEAEVRLLPNPAGLLNGVVFFPSDDLALAALDLWRGVTGLRMLEYVDGAALRMIETRYPAVPKNGWAALIIEQIMESGGETDEWLDRLSAAQALESESWFGSSDADRERFRKFRHSLAETHGEIARRNGFPALGTDFSVPIPESRRMLAFYRQHMDRIMPGRYCIFGHLGDGHPHVNMLPATELDFQAGVEAIEIFARQSVALGGSVAAEHGLGKRKAKLLGIQYNAEEIEAMKRVKRRFDPEWRLGRGTIFELPPE